MDRVLAGGEDFGYFVLKTQPGVGVCSPAVLAEPGPCEWCWLRLLRGEGRGFESRRAWVLRV